MFERILVPLDGSRTAEVVIPYVEEITAKFGGELTLVRVSESATINTKRLYYAYLKRTVEQIEKSLWEWGTKVETKVECKIISGRPADAILRRADSSDVGLVVMSSRGSSGKGPWVLGNIAAKVIRATSRPILLVRGPANRTAIRERRLIKRILVPLDSSEVGASAIPYSEALSQALGAEIVLFQVLQPIPSWGGRIAPEEMPKTGGKRKELAIAYLDDMAKPLKKIGLQVSSVVVDGSPADQIVDYASSNAIDLIAMSTHGLSGITRWVFGSVTDKVLHAGDTPVLVVRPAKV